MSDRQTVYAACILHPDNVLELLYTYDTREAATNCAYYYSGRQAEAWAAEGYDNEEQKPRIKILALDVKTEFDPMAHTTGLKLIGAVEGDFRHL